jgi:hypothetical protein
MRKLTMLVSLAFVVVTLLAAPALAQRDPFDPVIDPNPPTTTTDGTTSSGEGPVVQPVPGTDVMANTGSDPSPWLAIAYALVAVGAGAIVIAKLHQPAPIRTR